MLLAYEEFVDFIATGTTPASVANFQASDATKARVTDLIERQKSTGIDAEEESELAHFLQLEHLMRLAKARARQRLSGA